MVVPRSIKRMILYLGAGPRTDVEISQHLGIDEKLLMNAMTQKPYKDYFDTEHKANFSRLTLSDLGWEMLDEIRQEIYLRQTQRYAEIRYWVTTGIAVLALILALFR